MQLPFNTQVTIVTIRVISIKFSLVTTFYDRPINFSPLNLLLYNMPCKFEFFVTIGNNLILILLPYLLHQTFPE